MAQTAYQNDLDVKFPGRYTTSGRGLNSATNDETAGIPFGRVLVYTNAAGTKVGLPYSNQATLVLDGDLVASNVLAGNIVVNGVTTAYTETYATSHLATITALAAEIEAIAGVLTATVGGASNRTITVVADPETDIAFSSGAITGGAGQAGVTRTNTCSSTVAGIAVHSEKEPESDGTVYYNDLETVPYLTSGTVDIVTDDALDVTDTIYFRFYGESAADEKRGMIGAADGLGADTSPSTSLALTGSKPLDSVAAAGTATIRYNIP
jgi:hypothetical protein